MTDDEIAMLDFERAWWRHVGAKEGEIRRRWDISPTVYYLKLNALIDRADALEHDPMTVRRLQRMREVRRAARSARRAG